MNQTTCANNDEEDDFARVARRVSRIARISRLVTTRKINHTEHFVLLMIENLAHKKGCFASNEYLARRAGLSTSWLKNVLTNLRKKGLIVDRGDKGKRRLCCKLSTSKNRTTKSAPKPRTLMAHNNRDTVLKTMQNGENNTQTKVRKTIRHRMANRTHMILPMDTVSKDTVSCNFAKAKSQCLPSESLRASSWHAGRDSMTFFMESKNERSSRRKSLTDDFDIEVPEACKGKPAIRQIDTARARRFLSIVYKHGILSKMRRIRPASWAGTMRKAALVRGDEYLDQVLDHLDLYGSDPYCPRPRTALLLLQRIKEGQFDKHLATKAEERKISQVVISEDAQRVTKRLSNNIWPGDVLDKLPLAVQLSLDNYQKWLHSIKEVALDQRQRKLVKHVLQQLHSDTETVAQWFESVFDRVCNWDDWNGNIMREVLDPFSVSTKNKFLIKYTQIANEFTHDGGSRWKAIQEVVRNANRGA